jgi:SAM-dependent methyltransferase
MIINSWAQFPNHFHLTQEIEQINDEWLKDEFGVRLLHLGDLTTQLESLEMPFNCRFDAATKISCAKGELSICTEMESLPFDSDIFDAIVMSHVLEFAENPHDVLREVHRSLAPNKCLILYVLNPISLLGLHSVFGRLSKKWRLYQSLIWLRPNRIKDWLLLLGFEIEQECFIEHGWPSKVCLDINKKPMLSQLGKRFWPKSGSVWCIKVRKKEIPLTVEKKKWLQKKNVQDAQVAKPTFKIKSSED